MAPAPLQRPRPTIHAGGLCAGRMTAYDHGAMNQSEQPIPTGAPIGVPLSLAIIAAVHLAYPLIGELRGMPLIPAAFLLSLVLGAAYAVLAFRTRRERGFSAVINLIVGEDLGFLGAGLVMGYPWAEHLRPGTVVIVAIQFALIFPEIWRRQEAGRPIVAPARLAWFILAYALAFGVYALVKPQGIWDI